MTKRTGQNDEPASYAEAMNAAAIQSGLSNEDLGRRVGLSGARIGHIRRGYAPGLTTEALPRTINVVRLASVLNMDLRSALVLAGKGAEIPEGMSDSELWSHFNHLLIDPLEQVSDEDLAAEVARRLALPREK